MRKLVLLGLILFVASLIVSPVDASIVFSLNQGNSAISSYSPPYGTVTVSRVDNNNATVEMAAFAPYSFGAEGMVGLNLAGGGTFTVSAVSGTKVGGGTFGSSDLANNAVSSGNEDGWGSYAFTLKAKGAYTNSVTHLIFNVHTTSGLWITENAILVPNGSGYEVAAHVLVSNASKTDALATGYATGAVIPEPASIAVWSVLGAAGAAAAIRSRKRRGWSAENRQAINDIISRA